MSSTDNLSFKRITLRETYQDAGTCPTYTVTVTSRGKVFWDGYMYVDAVGRGTCQLDSEQLHRIDETLISFGLREFNFEKYLESLGESIMITSCPTTEVTVR